MLRTALMADANQPVEDPDTAEDPDTILDIPEHHLPYLEQTVYPTLLKALEKLLQRVEERPNDELNAINWLATYLHCNNPNNNLMRKVDDLAEDLRARRARLKQEAQDALTVRKQEEWREFAVNMASMRAQERVQKRIPSLLIKAMAPQVEREVFYKHAPKFKRGKTNQVLEAAADAACGREASSEALQSPKDGDGEEGENQQDSDEDSDVEDDSMVDLMEKVMNECVSKKRGQKPLFSVFFEFLKCQYQTNFAFIALREGSGEKEHLRVVAAFGAGTSELANATLFRQENQGDEALWDCLDTGEAKLVEDGSVLSLVDESMMVPFLVAALTKPPVIRDDGEAVKPEVIGMVAIAMPQLSIGEGEDGEGTEGGSEGIAKSSAKERSTIGEEEDEEEIKRNEMIASIQSSSAILGLALTQTWRHLNEPRIHRLRLATSQMIDACVSNTHLHAQGTKQLAKKICSHMSGEISNPEAKTLTIMGVMDDMHEKLWISGIDGGDVPAAIPESFHRDNNTEDLVWQAIRDKTPLHMPCCVEGTVLGMDLTQEFGVEQAVLVVPLLVPLDTEESEELELADTASKGYCVGVMVYIRRTSDPAAEEMGFTSDENAMAAALQTPLANSIHSIRVRESFEHVLRGLLRRYAGAHIGEAPLAAGTLQPQFEGPVELQFRRQIGQKVIDAAIHSTRLHPITHRHTEDGQAIKPDLGTGQPAINLVFANQKRTAEAQTIADEVKAVASIALASVCNLNHRSIFEFQARARICRRWMLASEALFRHQRLQLGRLTEAEVLELEPRNEPLMPNRVVITAVLTLLGKVPIAEIALWKKCRQHLGAPLLQQVVDFDPTSSDMSKQSCRDAIRCYREVFDLKSEMCSAAAALHDWMGSIFWVRKEMRAVADTVRLTTVEGLNDMIAQGNVERVRSIVEVDMFHGEGVDADGQTPLHAAATSGVGNDALTQLIVSMGHAKNMLGVVDKRGKTPMHHAVKNGHQPMVERLNDLYQDPAALNVVDDEQYTPLMHAASNKDVEILSQLLAAGADPNIIAEQGTAMDVASGWDTGVEILQSHGALTSGALRVKQKKEQEDAERAEEERDDDLM